MKSYLLDTNVFLRYLLADIPDQMAAAKYHFVQAKLGKISLTIPVFVFVEAVYTLTKFYGISKTDVVDKLRDVAQISYLNVEKRNILVLALTDYKTTSVSFIELLLFYEAKENDKELLTFDKKLAAHKK